MFDLPGGLICHPEPTFAGKDLSALRFVILNLFQDLSVSFPRPKGIL